MSLVWEGLDQLLSKNRVIPVSNNKVSFYHRRPALPLALPPSSSHQAFLAPLCMDRRPPLKTYGPGLGMVVNICKPSTRDEEAL